MQILLARAADEAMGTSTNGSGGDKENDLLSFSIFITTAFNKRQFYIFSIKDPIALADEEHGDGKVDQQATISRDILVNKPPDSDDLLLVNHHMEGTNKEESTLGKEAILRKTMRNN